MVLGRVGKLLLSAVILVSAVFSADVSPAAGTLFYAIKQRLQNIKTQDALSYLEFKEICRSSNLTPTEQWALVNEAYKNHNPYIFRKADRVVQSEVYSINLLWIHEQDQHFSEVDHLMGQNVVLLNERVCDPLLGWFAQQPDIQHLNFWYDSARVGEHVTAVIENSQGQLVSRATAQHIALRVSAVHFKDLRDLQIVKEHSEFLDRQTATYFRVDWAKVVTADAQLEGGLSYVINADSDVQPVVRASCLTRSPCMI